MEYRIHKPNHFSIHEFISPLATGTLDMLYCNKKLRIDVMSNYRKKVKFIGDL